MQRACHSVYKTSDPVWVRHITNNFVSFSVDVGSDKMSNYVAFHLGLHCKDK